MVAGPGAATSQPDLQRPRPEHLLGERHLPVGLGLGPVPRPRLRPSRRDAAARPRRFRSTRHDPLERFRNDLGSIDFARTPAAPGTGIDLAAPAGQHGLQLHRRLRRLRRRRDARSTGCARARSTATSPTTARPCCCPAATCRGPTPAATRPPRRRWTHRRLAGDAGERRRRRRRAREREHRAHRDPHAVRPRAQPDRRRAARQPVGRRTGSRSPAASSARRSSTSPTTSSCPTLGVAPARRTAATTRASTPALSNEFATVGYRAHSMIHGEFEPTVAPGDVRQRRSSRPSERRASWSSSTARTVDARDPARRRVRQPRPAGADRPRPDARGPRRRARVQATTSRSTTRCAASCSRCRSPASPTPPSAGRPTINPSCFSGVVGPRRDRHPARPRPRHAVLQPAAARVRAAPKDVVHGDHRRVDRAVPARPADRSTAGPDRRSRHPRLRRARRRRRQPRPARHPTSAGDGGRRAVRRTTLAARLKAIYGSVDKARRVRRDGLRAARPRHRVRGAAAGDVEEAVRGAARRRPVLLPQRPAARRDPARTTGSTTATRSPRSSR